MKVSHRWLLEYVETDLSPAEIANRLVHAGIEVESVTPLVAGLSGILVARVEAIEQDLGVSPAGHRLLLCRVATSDRKFSVVSGAPNVAVGVRAAFAPPGALLPGGRQIEILRIRGTDSEGMLCSEAELGIGEDGSGILILPDDAPLGASLVTYLGLDDTILDVEVAPNRPDLLSVVGVAREVAALTGGRFSPAFITLKEGAQPIGELTSVRIEDADLCPRYAARVVTGVTVSPSPFWLAQRLRAVGLRPINNAVDVTNYALWELGHPLHAFDRDRLLEGRIVVRRARPGESLRTLDGQPRSLTPQMLAICDAERPVALAGIMGGANTEVTSTTRTILLESACFQPGTVRRTAKALGLSTEASYRFERGADIEGVKNALDRAAQLIADVAGGTVLKGVVDVYPTPRSRPRVSVRLSRIERLVGTAPPKAAVSAILTGLGFSLYDRGESLEVEVPSFRRDVHQEEDLVEEVIRIWGYEKIPATLPTGRLAPARLPRPLAAFAQARRALAALGLQEAITLSLVSPAHLAAMGFTEHDPSLLRLRNPLSMDRSVLRPTLLPGLLEALATNQHRQSSDVRLFELGRIFRAGGPDGLAKEATHVGLAASGLREPRSWWSGRARIDLFDVKGVIEALVETLGGGSFEVRETEASYLEIGRAAEVLVAGQAVGRFGELHPRVGIAFDLSGPVFVAECSLDALLALPPRRVIHRSLPRFPGVSRDLAVVVKDDLFAAAVTQAILDLAHPWIRSVRLFDVYTGTQVGAGRKSLAYSVAYQAEDRTLTDEMVNELHQAIVDRLRSSLGAEVRGYGRV